MTAIVSLRADVSRAADVEAMFAKAIEVFGTLHAVVCNAGVQRDAAFE